MPILGEVRAIDMCSRSRENMFMPSEDVLADIAKKAYKSAGSSPDQVDHLDLFGFCHILPDRVEHKAVEKTFTDKTRFGCTKPEWGYFKGANPAIVLSKLILMNDKRTGLPHFSYDPESTIVTDKSPLKAATSVLDLSRNRRPVFGANLFGFGGNHGHIIVGSLPKWMESERVVEDALPVFATEKKDALCVLLSGQGAQHVGMMKELYESEAEIRTALDHADRIFKEERGTSLLSMMFEGIGGDLDSTENTQAAVFASSAAIWDLLSKRGLEADAFIGHSVGEYTALYTAGLLDFETAFRLLLLRASLMKQASVSVPGSIAAVFKGPEEVARLIKESRLNMVYVANKNSRKQTVVSGARGAMDQFGKFLGDKGVMFRKLKLSGAFHTPLFDSAAKGMKKAFKELSFKNDAAFGAVIANRTARPYPADADKVKTILVEQIVNPVEFIDSIEHLHQAGVRRFIELGPNQIVAKLASGLELEGMNVTAAVDPRKGAKKSFDLLVDQLASENRIRKAEAAETVVMTTANPAAQAPAPVKKETAVPMNLDGDSGFETFLKNNEQLVKEKLYEEYQNRLKEEKIAAFESFGFFAGSVSVGGAAIGLPGQAKRVFESDNFDRLLAGQNFIDPLTEEEKQVLVSKNITRLHKMPDGNARFMDISSTDEVIQLAGKLGYFDIEEEYGQENDYDIAISLAVAAGLEALKDANIPLVMSYKEASNGTKIPAGLALPADMQENTGVIMTSLFMGWDTLIQEVTEYYHHKFYVKPYQELEQIYYFLMEEVKNNQVRERITDWFFSVKKQRKNYGEYAFKRNFPSNTTSLGSAHFARVIKAKGPNVQLMGACASTTQAVGVAEDWIRSGRCERVIVIGGEAATTQRQSPWISSGFLALGAANTKKSVTDAAKPFDADRSGTILASGAVGMVVERTDRMRERGLNGQAEILGTYLGNSAFHTTRIDVKHLSDEMARFVSRVEKRHGLVRAEYAKKFAFMSHETYTPARGGSADAEIEALRKSFGEHVTEVTITNTKGFTGHTLGAAIEDAVLVKALQKGVVPPVANLKKIPDNFKDLKFSRGEKGEFEYGLHFAAGFGSHFAFFFIKKTRENSIQGNPLYTEWLRRISGSDNPVLKVVNKTLVIESDGKVIPARPATPATPAPAAVARPVAAAVPAPAAPALAPKADKKAVADKIKAVICELTGYTADMLEDDLDLEADLGIDTVKQVEIFGKISASFKIDIPESMNMRDLNTIARLTDFMADHTGDVASTVPTTGAPDAGQVMGQVKAIVAELTGYTEDMLEEDLDLEADLGIDTVKQVEIFGKLAGSFGLDESEDVNLRELNSIGKLAEFIAAKTGAVAAPAAAAPAATADSVLPRVKAVVAELTGYTEDMLDSDLDLEADLGIDTVKQVEIFGKMAAAFGLDESEDVNLRELNTIAKLAGFVAERTGGTADAGSVPAASTSPAMAHAGVDAVKAQIRTQVADLTGYTEDMLDDNLDLEADLGIDTVKQVEIFGKITASFAIDAPEDVNLRELNSIGKLAEFVADLMPSGASTSALLPDVAYETAAPSTEETKATIKSIIAEITGYTEDMLSDDLDLEADLGIDTVKQVEVFGKILGHFGLEEPEDLNMRELNTITAIVGFVESLRPAAPSAPAATPKAAPAAPAVDTKPVIKTIIAEITGYTEDMLSDDLDLEADLGIDTVKQVEVFGKIMGHFKLEEPEELNMRELNTITAIVSFIDGMLAQSKNTAPAAPARVEAAPAAPAVPVEPSESGVFRFATDIRELESRGEEGFSVDGKTVIVVKDEKGLAEEIGKRLEEKGAKLLTLAAKDADIIVDVLDPEAVRETMKGLDKDVLGLVLANGITEFGEAGDCLAGSLFAMVQELWAKLDQDGSFILLPTIASTVFATGKRVSESGIAPNATASGLAGFLKTAARELEKTRVKVVDFASADVEMTEIAEKAVTELLSTEGRVEIGFDGETRMVPMLLEEVAPETGNIMEGRTLLVTGGAGGITFEILKEAARITGNLKLILTGRSDINALDPELAAAEGGALMALLKKRMPEAKPLEIKKAADRTHRLKKAVANIETLKSMGANVIYYAADATDLAACEKIAAAHPEIDGLLHAAGLEESQILTKKTVDSFNRVFDTKIKGMRNLLKAFSDHDLKILSGFSSVTARFGNAGQCDYTAANDMLGKMLLAEKAARPDATIKVLGWTAWDGTGMATNPTVKKVLTERGLTFLPLAEGVVHFINEWLHDASVETVYTGKDYAFDPDGILPLPGMGPKVDWFLDKAVQSSDSEKKFDRTLALDRDPFLLDHAIEGTPLFLGATGIETLSEAAVQVVGKNQALELTEFYIPYGIKILKGRPKTVNVTATKLDENSARCTITSQFVNPKGIAVGDPKLHYQGTVTLGEAYPEVETVELPDLPKVAYEGELRDICYHPKRLFMDGVFGTLKSVEGYGETQMVTLMNDFSDRDFFAGEVAPDFKTPVVLVDAMFQTGGLFNMIGGGGLVLPSRIKRMRVLAMPERNTDYFCITEKKAELEETDLFDMKLVDARGKLLVHAEDFEMIRIGELPAEFSIADRFEKTGKKAVS